METTRRHFNRGPDGGPFEEELLAAGWQFFDLVAPCGREGHEQPAFRHPRLPGVWVRDCSSPEHLFFGEEEEEQERVWEDEE